MIKIQPNIDKIHIENFFDMLNKERISYSLIKNIAGELPTNLKDGKDIDILVKLEDREKFARVMGGHGFLYRVPPLGREGGWNFGYNLPEYQFWQLGNIPQTFYIDACFKLMCKSLTPKTWVPMNEEIQQLAWTEREWNERLGCWQLGPKTLFVYLFAREVFDKREFKKEYISEIEKRKSLIDDSEVLALLRTVFYNFTDMLVDLVKKSDYESIVGQYIKFQNY